MNVGIESHAGLADRLESVTLQNVEELLVVESHTLVKLVALFSMFERAVEVIDYRQEVADHAGQCVALEVGFLALGAFAEVLEVGERAQVAIAGIIFLRRGGWSSGCCFLGRHFHLMLDVGHGFAGVFDHVGVVIRGGFVVVVHCCCSCSSSILRLSATPR